MRKSSDTAAVVIGQEDPAQADIVTLLRNGEANSARLYPAESNHHRPPDALRAPEVRFLVARNAGGRAIATGALVLHGDWAEIKRMWVDEDARGRGVSKKMLDSLVSIALTEDVPVLRLETGVASAAALGLYEGAGFQRRKPFGGYKADPLSIFMEKSL
jgi:putative acetyltransferase